MPVWSEGNSRASAIRLLKAKNSAKATYRQFRY